MIQSIQTLAISDDHYLPLANSRNETRTRDDGSPGDLREAGQLVDLLEAPESRSVMAQVDRVLNLGTGIGDLTDLSREEFAEAFSILADLFDRGIVGYEYREINGQPQKVFIDVAIGNDAHRAPLYKDGRIDGYL